MRYAYALCASENAGPKEPVLCRDNYIEAMHFAKRLGFGGIEIHVRDAGEVDGEALKKASQETEIQIGGIASGLAKRIDGLSLVAEDPAQRARAIQRVKGHLDLAEIFGCSVVIGSMRDNVPSDDMLPEYLKRLADSVQELADYIRGKNCGILIEAINRYENNYLNTAKETVDFIKGNQTDQVKLLLDLYHMNIEARINAQAILDSGAYLGHVHISENNRRYPGDGQVDFASALKALEAIDYQGWLSFEYLPIPSEEEAARRGLEYMQKLEK